MIMSTMYWNRSGIAMWQKLPVIKQYNTAMETVAEEMGCLYIDIYSMLVDSTGYFSAEYAEVELVQEFWSSRSKWEDPFKLVLTATSDVEFEEKWNNAVENMKKVVDTGKMMSEVTEIAKGLIK